MSCLPPLAKRTWSTLAVLLVAGAQLVSAQGPVEELLREARIRLEVLDADSASRLLRDALTPGAGATQAQRVRGFVLLGICELTLGRQPVARQAFRAAIALDPQLNVDSLSEMHAELSWVFSGEREAFLASLSAPTSMLEIQVRPEAARVRVDDVSWVHERGRQEISAGRHVIHVRRAGYTSVSDTITVDTGGSAVRTYQLEPLQRTGIVELSLMPLVHGYLGLSKVPGDDPPIGGAVVLGHSISNFVAIAAGAEVMLNNRVAGRVSIELSPPMPAALRPYLLVGAHRVSVHPSSSSESWSSFGWHAGVGSRFFTGGRVALRFEARANSDGFAGEPVSIIVSAGVSFFFGGSRPLRG